MPAKIFVGNIAYGVTGDVIRPLFEHYGTVTECDILGSFGFVHMQDEDEAKVAIADLNGYDLEGMCIKVELSTVATQGKKRSTRSSTKIFIGNIKIGTTTDELRKVFEKHGSVSEADVIGGYGFVHMVYEREALEAIRALNGSMLNGNSLNVELSTRETQGKARGQDGFAPSDSFRGRGGMAWGPSRGRGRGAMSSRFDPYSAPPGNSWLLRSELYPGMDGYHTAPYRSATMLAAPPARAPAAGEDASFARDLLQLYTKDPAAFDAYARNPDVRRSLNLQSDIAPAAVMRAREDSYLKTPREYLMEQRLQQSRMLSATDEYSGLAARSAMLPSVSAHRGISGSMGVGSSAPAQLYMSFE